MQKRVDDVLKMPERKTEHCVSAMRDQETHNSTFNGDPLERSNIEIVFQAFAGIVIFLSSILANSVVLYAIQTNSRLKTFTNKIIANLCVVDMVETLLIMPLWITSLVKGHWIFGNVVCSISGYLFFAMANATLYSLLLIALSRYFKVVKPQLYNSIFFAKKNRPKILLALCWVAPLVICSPPLYGWGRYQYYPQSVLCTFEWSFEALNVSFMAFLVATQPSPYIICWCYFKIYNTVRRNRIQICTRANRAACQNAHNAENMCIHTTVGIACVVVLCWLPKALLVLLLSAGRQGLDLPLLISSYLVFLTCCLNPVVYGILNPQFKPAFKALFKKRDAENPNVNVLPTFSGPTLSQ